jgi:hypothetical protein
MGAVVPAGVAGLYEQLTGTHGSAQARQAAGEAAAARAGQAFTYVPRTEEGKEAASGIANFLTDTLKLPPYITGPGVGRGRSNAKPSNLFKSLQEARDAVNALPFDGTPAFKTAPEVKATPPAKGTTAAKPTPDALNPTASPVDAGLRSLPESTAVKLDPNLLNPADAAPTAGLPPITPRSKIVETAPVVEVARTPAQLEAARRSDLALKQAEEMRAAIAERDRLAAEQKNQPAPRGRKAKAEADAKAAELAAQLDEANKAVAARRAKEAAEEARRKAEADAR